MQRAENDETLKKAPLPLESRSRKVTRL